MGAGQQALRLLARRTRLSTGRIIQWVVLEVVRRVVEVLVLGHVLVHVLGLDLKEEAVNVRVEELAALSVLRFELVVMLGKIQNAHAHIHRRLLWTWIDAKPSSKILARANAGLPMRRLSLSSSCERTSSTSTRFRKFSMVFLKTEFFNLYRSFSKSLAAFFRSSSSKGFGGTGGLDGLWSDACPETCIAADSDSEAHGGPYYGGLGPASQPLSAPPQRLGGCADALTSIFSESPCAPVPADMHCARCVGLLGTQGLPRV